MERRRIDSAKNDRVKSLLRLRERRAREEEGRFLLEGVRETSRAYESGVALAELFACGEFLAADGAALVEELERAGVPVTTMSRAAFERVSHREGPDGIMAVAVAPRTELGDVPAPAEAGLYLVVEGLEKPGNLGALLRTADGTGVDAVFVTGGGTDVFNPNVIRASMGSVFARPVVPVERLELLAWFREHDVRVVATSPRADVTFWEADLRGCVAVVLGAEHEGLSSAWLEASGVRVSIPMGGLADSLNVATAGALLLYEALRQRRFGWSIAR